jgi:hypothetical protein
MRSNLSLPQTVTDTGASLSAIADRSFAAFAVENNMALGLGDLDDRRYATIKYVMNRSFLTIDYIGAPVKRSPGE